MCWLILPHRSASFLYVQGLTVSVNLRNRRCDRKRSKIDLLIVLYSVQLRLSHSAYTIFTSMQAPNDSITSHFLTVHGNHVAI